MGRGLLGAGAAEVYCERLQEVLGALPGAKRMVVSGEWGAVKVATA